jgi:penicillin-binding protein 1C
MRRLAPLPGLLLLLGQLLGLALAPAWVAAAVPAPSAVRAAWQPSEARLLDRHGVLLDAVRVDMRARRGNWVVLEDVSPALGAAVLQAEDQRFMQHGGVDLRAAGQAAWDNLLRARPRGASTITMQLAGLLDAELRAGRAGRSWLQKFDQALAAREIEAGWSKRQILEAYLNLASFRGELQGVGAAARALFNKAPSGLDGAESAILAALLRAPAAPSKAVASRACRLGAELKWPMDCAAIAWRAAVALARPVPANGPGMPPALRRLLGEAGLGVRTTLDGRVQAAALEALRRHVRELADRNVGDGAVVVIDNASGELLAYVANTATGRSTAWRPCARPAPRSSPSCSGWRWNGACSPPPRCWTTVRSASHREGAPMCRRTTTGRSGAMPACAPAWPAR